jgi:TRAP-type C4-dicarboxylate transport system permease small subunit
MANGMVTGLSRFRTGLERVLEAWLVIMIVTMTVIVVVAVIWRKAGASFIWYDEVASVLLAWITYYGAALGALKRGHIGFDGILLALPMRWRMVALAVAEAFVFLFFIVLAWTGWQVLGVLQGMSLISLPWVPVMFTQSVIPIGAVLFIICEALSLPDYVALVRGGVSQDELEVTRHLQDGEA